MVGIQVARLMLHEGSRAPLKMHRGQEGWASEYIYVELKPSAYTRARQLAM